MHNRYRLLHLMLMLVISLSCLSCRHDSPTATVIKIGDIPLVTKMANLEEHFGRPVDSSKTSVNACFFLDSDSCTSYTFRNGAVYLSANGELYFNSLGFTRQFRDTVSVGGLKIVQGLTVQEFTAQAKNSKLPFESENTAKDRDVYSVSVSEGCNFYMVFKQGRIDSVFYGIYGFLPAAPDNDGGL